MTCSKSILHPTHRNARRIVEKKLRFCDDLYTNNQNLQVLIFFEAFRQTAYAMIPDGGPGLAIELMEKVIDEMREVRKARRAKSFDENSFAKSQDHKRDLDQLDYFMDIPFADEVLDEDEIETDLEEQETDDGFIKISPFVHYRPGANSNTKKIGVKQKT